MVADGNLLAVETQPTIRRVEAVFPSSKGEEPYRQTVETTDGVLLDERRDSAASFAGLAAAFTSATPTAPPSATRSPSPLTSSTSPSP